MAVEVVMPKLGMAMKEGSVSLWHKKEGDPVTKGEIIANIGSEKIETDLEAPADGVLLKIAVPEGEGVPPGTIIGYIGQPGEQVGTAAAGAAGAKPGENAAADAALPSDAAPAGGSAPAEAPAHGRDIKISPVARKMAEAAGLDIAKITGTGPQGRITKEDVEHAIANAASTPASAGEAAASSDSQASVGSTNPALAAAPSGFVEHAEQIPVAGIRKVIAARMLDSLQQSAQLTLTLRADVTDLLALQKRMSETAQKQHEVKLTVTDFIARAVVLSLKRHKQMNSAYIGDRIHVFDHVHLGIAVALDKGLVVPVIRHADQYSVLDLSRHIKALAQQARSGQLGSDALQGSTFTITNLGAYGIDYFTPILNTPEAGILGVGAVTDTPVYRGDELQRRSLLPLSLTFDHRVLDGAPAAEFLRAVKDALEDPYRLVL
ncbi:dihydrolipoamide acetyltransferase family protein [Paenibacillus ehimensis]|uniref:Dihydrolipoamide acetyltransferase component of pyruvate dehydrogenase complex n=1 Tax=Paenibacillus ehimensis TaxID=79264 RepID=A0ABT8V884_9BACL|nr:dihydrolipoamide acetyltransferase family protein [Paenibacillus ehimensis]MDO3676672.1 dihydrolipoamide acetyltransferase family protein [Paenibacillus ehimensis]MEC0212988.1 dihydrolipoamide acetyltransferase family protein [Paenibacillus ehimensis]